MLTAGSTAVCVALTAFLFSLVFGTHPAGFQASPAPQQPPTLASLLTRYSNGDLLAAKSLADSPDKARVLRTFEGQARRWIEADSTAQARRRLTAATFVLEVVQHWAGEEDWQYARRLMAWGCAELRATPIPAPVERLWHLAAVAVAEGAEDWPMLTGRVHPSGRPAPAVRNPLQNELGQGHLSHAVARFPDEPRFAMAVAVAAENHSWEVGGVGRDLNFRGGLTAGDLDPAYLDRLRSGDLLALDGSTLTTARQIGRLQLARVDEVRALRAKYLELTRQPSVAAEAHLRLGLVAFRLSEREVAVRHLADAFELAREPHVSYLARLFTGAIRDRQGLHAAAIDEYRAALTIVPRAQSATSLLVVRLVGAGRQAEAADLTDAFFAGGPPPADPWRTYRLGDLRLLPAYLARLRAEAK